MIQDGVLVDTPVLIDFFRGQGTAAEAVTDLLQKNHVVITGIIIAELLQGMKNLKEEFALEELLSATHQLEVTNNTWLRAGKLALSLRRMRINLPLTDVAIAALALKHDFSILTNDKHFEQIPGLKIYSR
ncbi:MAG: PIN domain-containing protein [Alphaproteobacteria bacterium]|uniref:Ribonuclease VapC n=1 Tax=Candidatus Nitrobium versatile TaxID=2884831 RepID=A0A953J4C4_9BACT|nr:PIN domain-containing protein [Candidatus Nitrobium versatile]